MLRVGLTGGLGSGKSTIAAILRELGAEVIEADELGRALMEPGQPVYAEIVRVFGPEVVGSDGRLDRPKLAKLAFGNGSEGGRLDELNAIVHPATIAAQRVWMQGLFAKNPNTIAIVESALIFEVERDARARGESDSVLNDWRNRFDKLIVVTAPDDVKIARFTARIGKPGDPQAEADARARLARQLPDTEKAARADYLIENTGSPEELRLQVKRIWSELLSLSNNPVAPELLQ